MPWLFVAFVLSLLLLAWMTRVRAETFADMPDPHVLFKRARTLLDTYDRPEIWNDMIQMMDKDPGELARIYQKQKQKEGPQ